MAIKATIFKAELQVSDLDRGHFATHALTIARHPSETDERMMVRLLAFALNADEALEFGRGLSAEDEADLLKKDLTGAIELWIDVGLPDEREIRKASGRAREVKLYLYGGRGANLWWEQNRQVLERLGNLTVVDVPPDITSKMKAFAARSMRLDCTIQEGEIWLASGEETMHFRLAALMAPG
jgi:uncharacterized protein YaeQ